MKRRSIGICVEMVVLFLAGSVLDSTPGFYMAQVSELEHRRMQRNRIRGGGGSDSGSDVGNVTLRCSDSSSGTGSYMGHLSGVEGTGAFDDVEVLLTCGNGVLETTVPGPDGGFVFTGLPDGDYVVTVRKTGYRGPPARPFRLERRT